MIDLYPYGLHFVSINKTIPISNKTHKYSSLSSLLLFLLLSIINFIL